MSKEKLEKAPDAEELIAQEPEETIEAPKVLFATAGDAAEVGSGPDDQHNQPA